MSSLQSIIDELKGLHYSKLQKFCRKGPDAPFDQLLLTRDEWTASLATGAGCKEVMIEKITKYHNANEDKKKKQPKPAMREAYEASDSDSDSGPDSPTGDAVPAPEQQEQLYRLAHWQEYYKANWISVPGRKDTPPAVKFTTRADKPLQHTVWLEASTKFYKKAFDALKQQQTKDDQILRATVLGEKLAKLLLAKNSGDSTGTVHLALMDGVGRILFETLRVTRKILTAALAENKDQDADELLNKKLSVTIYDIMRNMNDCHRLLMPNVTIAAANIIPGNGAAHLEGVDVVYFNFSSLIMSDKGKVRDFVEGAYQTNKAKELSAESQKDKLRDCILALPKATKVMVSVYTARAAESLEDVLPSDDFVLKSVSARANFETAWVRKIETA